MIEINVWILVPLMAGKARCHQGFRQIRDLRNLNSLLVQEGAATPFGGEQLVARRIKDYAGDSLVLMLQRHGNAENGKAVGKVSGAVQGVNVPAIIATGVDQTLFFAEDIVAGPARFDALADQDLGVAIRNRNQIGIAFVFHFHVLEKILHQQGASFAGDFGHGWDELVVVRWGHRFDLFASFANSAVKNDFLKHGRKDRKGGPQRTLEELFAFSAILGDVHDFVFEDK